MREQRLLDGAADPGKGVQTFTRSRHRLTIRPRWLAPVADRIGLAVLGRDIERRLDHFARACAEPGLVARAVAQLAG